MTTMSVSGWMFLPVPAHPGCPGQIPQSCKMVVCCVCVFQLLLTNISLVCCCMGYASHSAVCYYCGCRRTPRYLSSPRWHDWSVSTDGSRLLVAPNDREGDRLLLAAWRISGGCRRGVTWLALAQARGDTTSPVSRLQKVEQQRSVLCWVYRVISRLILYYIICWNQLYPRFRDYHTALHRLRPSLSLPVVHTNPRWKSLIRSNWVPPFSLPLIVAPW